MTEQTADCYSNVTYVKEHGNSVPMDNAVGSMAFPLNQNCLPVHRIYCNALNETRNSCSKCNLWFVSAPGRRKPAS